MERLGLAFDSGGPGKRRGGLGYFKEFSVLCDCEALSNADRSFLAPWGTNGGGAGGLYQLTVNPGRPGERGIPALRNRVAIAKRDLIRVVTTGGGGLGDPLERESDLVCRDVLWGKVSVEGAVRNYGVVFQNEESLEVDENATTSLRDSIRSRRGAPAFFDRGVNYSSMRLSG